jgi:hypothetical protein
LAQAVSEEFGIHRLGDQVVILYSVALPLQVVVVAVVVIRSSPLEVVVLVVVVLQPSQQVVLPEQQIKDMQAAMHQDIQAAMEIAAVAAAPAKLALMAFSQ